MILQKSKKKKEGTKMEIKKVIKMLIEDIKRNGFYNPANEHF